MVGDNTGHDPDCQRRDFGTYSVHGGANGGPGGTVARTPIGATARASNASLLGVASENGCPGGTTSHADPDDGRIKRLRLARRGRSALAAARRLHRLYERRLAERLD